MTSVRINFLDEVPGNKIETFKSKANLSTNTRRRECERKGVLSADHNKRRWGPKPHG